MSRLLETESLGSKRREWSASGGFPDAHGPLETDTKQFINVWQSWEVIGTSGQIEPTPRKIARDMEW